MWARLVVAKLGQSPFVLGNITITHYCVCVLKGLGASLLVFVLSEGGVFQTSPRERTETCDSCVTAVSCDLLRCPTTPWANGFRWKTSSGSAIKCSRSATMNREKTFLESLSSHMSAYFSVSHFPPPPPPPMCPGFFFFKNRPRWLADPFQLLRGLWG